MKSFNHRFNTCCMRVAFWQKLRTSLASIESQIRGQEYLTPEDMRVLNIVRKALRNIYSRSKRTEKYHSLQLQKLRKEYVHEC